MSLGARVTVHAASLKTSVYVPSHLVQRIDLDKLWLPFAEKLLELLANCERRGVVYVATSGYRSPREQAKLYFQGRTVPGEIVTNARPGYSSHNYGLAVDVCRDVSAEKGLQPDWQKQAYDTLASEGIKLDLEIGVPGLKDYGHVQLPLRAKFNKPEKELLQLFKDMGSLEAVWAFLAASGDW